MKTKYHPTRDLTEIIEDTQEYFKKENGRLLTEEEAIKLTEKIKEEIYKERNK